MRTRCLEELLISKTPTRVSFPSHFEEKGTPSTESPSVRWELAAPSGSSARCPVRDLSAFVAIRAGGGIQQKGARVNNGSCRSSTHAGPGVSRRSTSRDGFAGRFRMPGLK